MFLLTTPSYRCALVRQCQLVLACWLSVAGAHARAVGDAKSPTGEGETFFESKIRPLLTEHCYDCHSTGKKQKGGLLLDSKAGWIKGGDTKPPIVPGDPEQSLLIQAVRWKDEDLRMPPEKAGGKLTDAQIADLEAWIKMGAPDPRSGPAATLSTKSWAEIFAERKEWWDLQPVRAAAPPAATDPDWSGNEVDRFLRARMDREGIPPAELASSHTLIRRASLVLTGLPPTPAEVEAFVAASSQNPAAAYQALVDRLLASPHFGERFARHWLDVVRFSETSGPEFNYDIPFAWRYRDYAIRAFNSDVPYDQFVREHIAGDLLAHPRWNTAKNFNESAIGTAFFRFGEISEQSCAQFPTIGFDIADNQLDTLTKAFQASTVACARCHDHKLDAISTKDYYALLGILRSSRSVQRTLDGPEVNRQPLAELKDLKIKLRAALATQWRIDTQAIDADKLTHLCDSAKAKEPPVSAPLHVWFKVFPAGATTPTNVASAWAQQGTEIGQESAEHAKYNADNFTTVADFRTGTLAGWTADGMGLRDGAGRSGDFTVAHDGEAAVDTVLPAGVFTFALSDKLNGVLRSPELHRANPFLSFEVVGRHNSLARLVFNNCQLNDHKQALRSSTWTWATLNLIGNVDQLHPYAELMTFWDNPKFPEPQGPPAEDSGQHGAWSEYTKNPRTWWGLRRVVGHKRPGTPKEELTHLARLFAGPTPASANEAAARYARIAADAVEAFGANHATDDDVTWLNWLLQNHLLTNRSDASPQITALTAQYRDIEQHRLALPRTIAGVADEGAEFNQPVLVRGDVTKPGEVVERRYLEMLARPGQTFDTHGSGRRALAELIASPANPLTARVMVNRVWQWIFGAGIVRTPDDFGHIGDRPSHPELLDSLTAHFMADGWSVKKLVRTIVLSRAFQSSATPTAIARARDPQNLLLSHYSAHRSEAEVIRDSILTVSGRLDPKLFGPSIPPYREKPEPQERLLAGPLDGEGRRSIYIKFQLMEAARFLSAFNLPGGKVSQGHRDSSNVPAQSLALLNDPFVLAMADFWAARLLRTPATPEARVDTMFQAALGRPPADSERSRFIAGLQDLAKARGVEWKDAANSRPLWKDAAHTIFNFSEFIFVP